MKKKAKKRLGKATLARVKKEMAKPRLAMSAREGDAKLQLHSLSLLRRAG